MNDFNYFILAMIFNHFFKIAAAITIIAILISCGIHPDIQERQEKVIPAPVEDPCDKNTITYGKPKCGG